MPLRIPVLLLSVILTSCSRSPPTPPTDCIVLFGVAPEAFAAIQNVQVLAGGRHTGPKALPGCRRVLAVGQLSGALAAQTWACESRIPDALLLVDATVQPTTCASDRRMPVLRYARFPAHGQKEEAVLSGLEGWLNRNQAAPTFQIREDGDLFCRVWPHPDVPMASCLIPAGKGWPSAVASELPLANPAVAGWEFALEAWE